MKIITIYLMLLGWTLNAHAEGKVEVWSVEGGMEAPLTIGIRGRADFKNNFYATAGVGFAPEFLMNMNGSFQSGFGLSKREEADAAAQALAGSTVVEFRFGTSLSQYIGEGWYADGGYAYYTGGRGKVKIIDLQEVTDQFYPAFSDTKVTVMAQTHNLLVHMGYDLAAGENFHLLFEAGLVKPVAVSTDLTAGDYPFLEQQMQDDFEDAMSKVFVNQGFYLTASIWASYLF